MSDTLDLWQRAVSEDNETITTILVLNQVVITFWDAFHKAKNTSAPPPRLAVSENDDGTFNWSYENLPMYIVSKKNLIFDEQQELVEGQPLLALKTYLLDGTKDDLGLQGLFRVAAEVVVSQTELDFDHGEDKSVGDWEIFKQAWNELVQSGYLK